MTDFEYTPTVPFATNNPSDDQPDMLINTVSIQNLIAQDHVTFNLPDGGFHQQVNFNANNIPAVLPSAGQSVIFTKNNSVAQPFPFFLNQLGPAVANALPMLPDVIQPIPNVTFATKIGNLILNWGTGSGASPVTIAFPAGHIYSSNTYAAMANFESASANVISIGVQKMAGSVTFYTDGSSFLWFCIGI